MSHPQHSVAVTLSCISGDRTYWFINEKLFIFSHYLKFLQIIHDMTASSRLVRTSKYLQKGYPGLLRYRVL